MTRKISAVDFALSRISEPHQHHRHCVHNLSYQEQYDAIKRRMNLTDEEMRLLKLDRGIVTITPDQWEIDVPDLALPGDSQP